MAKAGSQGLLDIAFTPGSRFKKPLRSIEPKLNFKNTLKIEISKLLTSKNKAFAFIEENFDYKALKKFGQKGTETKKFSKKDFRTLKKEHNVDEILYLNARYGLLVQYYGFIEIGKQGYTNITTEIIDLEDNSLLQRERIFNTENIKGSWKKGNENYDNMKNAIQKSIEKSIATLKIKF